MRLLTYNVNRLRDASGEDTRARLLDWIRGAGADVIALQLTDEAFANEVAEALLYRGLVFSEAHQGFGNALVTQLCVEAYSSVTISTADDPEPRTLLLATLLVTRLPFPNLAMVPIVVGVTHLENTKEDVRMRQIHKAVETLRAAGDEHVLCGDLNALRRADYAPAAWEAFERFAAERQWDPREERVTAYLEQQGYADAFLQAGDGPATTFFLPPAQMHLRLDYVYTAPCFPLRVVRCWRDDSALSCHMPVTVDFSAVETAS